MIFTYFIHFKCINAFQEPYLFFILSAALKPLFYLFVIIFVALLFHNFFLLA